MEIPNDSVSKRLRTDTAGIHARVEAGMDLLGRMGSREGYVATLIRMEAFYRAVEPVLAAAAAGHLEEQFLESRHRRLVGDLDACEPHWQPDPSGSVPELLGTWPFALGGVYVMEGAALGGQVISRHIRERLQLPTAFFGGEGGAIGPRWKRFREILDGYPKDYEAILTGAGETFLAFEKAVVGEVNSGGALSKSRSE